MLCCVLTALDFLGRPFEVDFVHCSHNLNNDLFRRSYVPVMICVLGDGEPWDWARLLTKLATGREVVEVLEKDLCAFGDLRRIHKPLWQLSALSESGVYRETISR